MHVAEERIANIRTVKSFSQEGRECDTYGSKLQNVLQLTYKESLARGIFFGLVSTSPLTPSLILACSKQYLTTWISMHIDTTHPSKVYALILEGGSVFSYSFPIGTWSLEKWEGITKLHVQHFNEIRGLWSSHILLFIRWNILINPTWGTSIVALILSVGTFSFVPVND